MSSRIYIPNYLVGAHECHKIWSLLEGVAVRVLAFNL